MEGGGSLHEIMGKDLINGGDRIQEARGLWIAAIPFTQALATKWAYITLGSAFPILHARMAEDAPTSEDSCILQIVLTCPALEGELHRG